MADLLPSLDPLDDLFATFGSSSSCIILMARSPTGLNNDAELSGTRRGDRSSLLGDVKNPG